MTTNFAEILALSAGGASGLAANLAIDDTTGANNFVFSVLAGAALDAENNPAGAGATLAITGSDAGAGVSTGGDIDLTPGLGFGGGANGVVNIVGDLVVTGSLTLTNLASGTGNPEGVLALPVGAFYSRTDGGAGNSQYFKQGGGAGTTGWVPAGPLFCEEFTSVGAPAFVTTRAVFDDPVGLGVCALVVFWNGVLQREGGAEDYTVVYGGASATITFNVTPPTSDLITIQYLPE